MAAPGRQVDAVVHLLDRQVVDPDDHMVCNIDDVELTVPDDGGPPYVSAILAGPAALAPRYGGLLGRWVLAVQQRLHPAEAPEPARIDFGVVDEVSSRARISLRRDELWVNAFEAWCRDNVIAKLPGAHHANE
jgi:hypothetical protein